MSMTLLSAVLLLIHLDINIFHGMNYARLSVVITVVVREPQNIILYRGVVWVSPAVGDTFSK